MIAFAAACTLLFFNGTTAQTQVPMAIVSIIVVISVGWSVYTAWDTRHSWKELINDGIKRLRGLDAAGQDVTSGNDSKARDRDGGAVGEHEERVNEVHPMKSFLATRLERIRGPRKQTVDSDRTQVGTLP